MNLIVAVNDDWGIGKDGTQSVVLPEDRKLFHRLTDGATVIVGRRTLMDFPGGKPLTGRDNIVLSRNSDLKINGATVVSSLDELFEIIEKLPPDKVFVIGGDSVFKILLPYVTTAYVTKIHASPESDSFFPNLDKLDNWTVTDAGEPLSHNGIDYAFLTYHNAAPLHYQQREDN